MSKVERFLQEAEQHHRATELCLELMSKTKHKPMKVSLGDLYHHHKIACARLKNKAWIELKKTMNAE